ncbi:iron hydrogenase [Trichodelitschia bisporula]|uniref:Nuclear architecture-related protein 1 n=1 Tax=Trichodelitschia bisporula TaxID=703511 RepID=A0A6G1HZK5_9PEZI|nr:iron hydrogenase [Trichodelitschia bisporula]
MSAILSADDLNDFISPGVACIKPIETLPQRKDPENPYEVTTEDNLAASNPTPAQISLTDCLACSGCVTSAEAVLVSLQSHNEVLSTLDAHPSLDPAQLVTGSSTRVSRPGGKIFVASISPQARASLAATYNCTAAEADALISQFLSGPQGLAAGGVHGSAFTWVVDTNILRSAGLVLAADEVSADLAPFSVTSSEDTSPATAPKRPILSSACPGWICYAEKTHPHILPYLSRLKSPQALTGTLLKSVLSRKLNIPPSRIWHLALMPCFDKKLEAARDELTSTAWAPDAPEDKTRDVDCVITPRELISLAAARGIDFASLPRTLPKQTPFPDPTLSSFLFPQKRPHPRNPDLRSAGTSGGFLWHVVQRQAALHAGSEVRTSRGRNADVVEYAVMCGEETLFRAARYYGFRNIQNLVRRLKPARTSRLLAAAGRGGVRRPAGKAETAGVEYQYVEVMACPGGCTNGGGQVRAGEVEGLRSGEGGGDVGKAGVAEQKAWLGRVDEAYWSAEEDEELAQKEPGDLDVVDGISRKYVMDVLEHWAAVVGVPVGDLVRTGYRRVESDVGKVSDIDRAAAVASSIGGGW